MQIKRVIIAVIILTAVLLACANPLTGGSPPDRPVNVETIVAMTFQALTASAPEAGVTPPPLTSSLLPRSLYFLNNDAAGRLQIYRLDRDGKTQAQITFEPADVDIFDISPKTGQVAYISNNQLLMVNSGGSARQLILDGGTVDENNPFLTQIGSPVWSPNGETIAYGKGGLNFYAVATGASNLLLENKVENPSGDFVIPGELYSPVSFPPDGAKLLIQLSYMEGGVYAIYIPSSKALIRLSDSSACCGARWSPDSNTLYAALATTGMYRSGLWRIDANSGQVTTLIPGDADNNTWNFADAPQIGPDGQLYFFFANTPVTDEFMLDAPLQLVRSAPDGVTGRTLIRPEIFNTLNEALWSPDGSFVIAANAPIDQVYQGGVAELYYVDGRPMVPLVDFAFNMKWGP